ncbi:MAG TPA: hypothetical protein VGO00_24475 [Kofleriaceae bacterium]|nr:hypothetical protein [Kofleriaceae bacterium]
MTVENHRKVCALAIAMIACSSPKPTTSAPSSHDAPPATTQTPPAPTGTAPVAAVHQDPADHSSNESPHGAPIDILAIADGARAALTGDELGGTRLWPALDGSREPRVVDLPRAKRLAVGVRGDGFVAALVDEVGGVVVTAFDADGRKLSHATLGVDPPFTGIAMTASGALAWRSDQTIVLVDPKLGVTSKLVAEPGSRLISIGVSGERVIAIVDNGKRRARWLTVAPKLAWGAWLKDGPVLGDFVALSPTGKRFATIVEAVDKTPEQIVVVDATTGKLVASTPGHDTVGFVDDDHLAIGGTNGIVWFDLTKPTAEPTPPTPGVQTGERSLIGVGGGVAVTAADAELVIATPTAVHYLGYELLTPAVAAAGPKGQLMIGLNDTFAMLDSHLHATTTPSLGLPAASTVAYIAWLGGDDWLVEASKIADGSTSLSLVDIAHQKSTPVKDKLSTPEPMQHEPSTELVTLSLGDSPEVMHFDPARHSLDKVAAPAKPKGYEQTALIPVSPKLANGTQIIAIHTRDRVKISWLKDPRALEQEASSVTVDGSFAGVDPAGHVFVWQNNAAGKLEIVTYLDGKRLGTLPTEGQTALWPDPSGQRIIEITPQSIGLFTLDGKRVWMQMLAGANEAVWLGDGSIAVLTSSGVARLDAQSGAIAATRCGWRFGLSVKPHPQSAHLEPVCAQM